jgi:hypothetical protein
MRPRNRGPSALALLALVGCTLTQSDLRKESNGTQTILGGRVISPKRCTLKMSVIVRPFKDPVVNDKLWSAVDEQVVDSETHRALEINGLRVGVLAASMPPEVQAALDAPPPEQVTPSWVVLPNGETSLFDTGAVAPQLSLFLSRDGQGAVGKNYEEAHGFLRLTANQDESNGVLLRIVPELHHGPVQSGWGPAPGAGANAPQQFILKNGQKEETFRDLATSLTVAPSRVVVVGARPDKKGGLGDFLFISAEPNSDRLVQKVLIIWPTRGETELPAEQRPAPRRLQPVDPPDMPRRPGDSNRKPASPASVLNR